MYGLPVLWVEPSLEKVSLNFPSRIAEKLARQQSSEKIGAKQECHVRRNQMNGRKWRENKQV